MIRITARFRPSRSRQGDNSAKKPGVVYFRITRSENGRDSERNVNSDIRGLDDSVLRTERNLLTERLRLLYCIIEWLDDSTPGFKIDDIADGFRKALVGEPSMARIVAKARREVVLRADLVSVGREFKSAFRFGYKQRDAAECKDLFSYIVNRAVILRSENRISQSRACRSVLTSLRDFTSAREIRFEEIDAGFIRGYAGWLATTAIAASTRSFYLRTLRSILSHAAADNLLTFDARWFMVKTLRPKESGFDKRTENAVDRHTLQRIEQIDLTHNPALGMARDMFMFGFYCRGMELVDIAHLSVDNIRDGVLTYRRRRKGLLHTVRLGRQAQAIVSRYRASEGKFLFPLLDNYGAVLFSSVRNVVAQHIKAIGKAVECPGLTFSMNIGTWKLLMAETNIPEMLLSVS